MTKSTIDAVEVAKFDQRANQWWNPNGPFKTLHDINPIRIAFIQKYAGLKHRTVLDVGSGGGILSEGMAKQGAFVTGLDVASETIHVAKAHAKSASLDIDYVCCSIETYQAEPFELITCMEMLEHVTDPQIVIDHCARLLKPGGHLFLSTINRTWQAYTSVIIAAEYLLGILPRQTHDYEKFIRPSELTAMVRRAGLEVVGLSGMAYNPYTRTAYLQEAVRVNYLLACYKPEL